MMVPKTVYHHAAERTTSMPFRLWIRHEWYHRAVHARKQFHAIDSSIYANLLCIHPFEEPSWSTVAGGLGFVYPPSAYNIGATDALAAQYGDSWYTWPVQAQLAFGAELVKAYGYSPWSTAFRCGL